MKIELPPPEDSEKTDEIVGRIYLQVKTLMPNGNYPESQKLFPVIIFDINNKL